MLTSIFPERDQGCYVQIHPRIEYRDLYRKTLNHTYGRGIEGRISLRDFIKGAGTEIAEARLLVYVKAVGKPTSCKLVPQTFLVCH